MSEKSYDQQSQRDKNTVKNPGRSNGSAWVKWAVVALLAAGIGSALYLSGVFGGEPQYNGASTFMGYNAPVLPLTMAEENVDITAIRDVHMDFAPYIPYQYSQPGADSQEDWHIRYREEAVVTDRYTLNNTSDQAQTVTLYYPTTGMLSNTISSLPTVTVDGQAVETKVLCSRPELQVDGISQPLYNTNSFEDYQMLFQGCDPLAYLEAPYVSLDIPVTLYRFTDHRAEFAEAINPTLQVSFYMDVNKTTCLTHGFNSGSWNEDSGERIYGYSIPEPGERGYAEPRYLIVLGDDVNCAMQGYETGGFDSDNVPMQSATATVERTETTLLAVLETLCEETILADDYYATSDGIVTLLGQERLLGLVGDFLQRYEMLAQGAPNLYDPGMLDEIIPQILHECRIFYSQFTVTIPAGQDLTVVTQRDEGASVNYGGGGKDTELQGYGMATSLGSNLIFTEQSLSMDDRSVVEIVNQNCGLDPEAGVTAVTLDASVAHYYLELKVLDGVEPQITTAPTSPPTPVPPPEETDTAIDWAEGDLYAVVNLGYRGLSPWEEVLTQTQATWGLTLPEYYELVGDECYLIVPRYVDSEFTICENNFVEADLEQGALLAEFEGGAPFVIFCNPSDLYPNHMITLTSGEGKVTFSVSTSLKDGTLNEMERGIDLSVYPET